MQKEKFCQIIKDVIEESLFEEKIEKFFGENNREDCRVENLFCNFKIINHLLDTLEDIFSDNLETIHWWISEYLFFGFGPSVLVNDEMISLDTPEQLYDFLVAN